jgi:opacity protein-like surface antigen
LSVKNAFKTAVLLAAGFLAVSGEATSAVISIRAGGAYFRPTDAVFREIYGSGASLGAEIGLALGRRFEAWLSGSTFSKKGKLTFTAEDTEIGLTPLAAGLRFYPVQGRLRPYLGAGASYFFYKESSRLGMVKDQKIGLTAHGGLDYALTPFLAIDLRVGYSQCKVKPGEFEADLGGIEAGVGLVLRLGRPPAR